MARGNPAKWLVTGWRRWILAVLVGLILLPQPWSRKLGQLRNLLWNLWVLPDTLRERHRISRRRVRNDQDLAHLIVKSKDVPITL